MTQMNVLKKERMIGYNVFEIMKKRNLTEEQLAEMVHIPEIRIKAILTGSTDIQEDEIYRIANELRVAKEELEHDTSDEVMKDYNVHYMGTATNAADISEIMDKVDMYVRLVNIQSGE